MNDPRVKALMGLAERMGIHAPLSDTRFAATVQRGYVVDCRTGVALGFVPADERGNGTHVAQQAWKRAQCD